VHTVESPLASQLNHRSDATEPPKRLNRPQWTAKACPRCRRSPPEGEQHQLRRLYRIRTEIPTRSWILSSHVAVGGCCLPKVTAESRRPSRCLWACTPSRARRDNIGVDQTESRIELAARPLSRACRSPDTDRPGRRKRLPADRPALLHRCLSGFDQSSNTSAQILLVCPFDPVVPPTAAVLTTPKRARLPRCQSLQLQGFTPPTSP
jgi:hypothetical protein